MQIFRAISMKEFVFVDPHITFPVDLSKAVKVELSHQRLETVMAKVLRQCFRFQTLEIGTNDESITGRGPLSQQINNGV